MPNIRHCGFEYLLSLSVGRKWRDVTQGGSVKIIKYSFNMRECIACKRPFNSNSNNHHYCSENCKMMQGIEWSYPSGIIDVIGFHNKVAQQINARWIRFGTRVTKGIRYFPTLGEELPLTNLPPLPHVGAYIVQFFGESRNPLPYDRQPIILIPSTFCKFSEGSRSSVLRE